MGIAVITRPDRVNVSGGSPDEDPEALRRALMSVTPDDTSSTAGRPGYRGYPNPDARENPRSPPDPGQGLRDFSAMAQPINLPAPNYKREHLAAAGGAAPGTPPDPSQLSDPMQDPSFREFVAQRALDLAELRAAQGQANDARNSFGMRAGNALITAGMVGGIGADPTAMLRQRYEQAGQPVSDVLERQKATGDLTKNASADVGLSGEMLKNRTAGEENTPGSPYSMAMSRLLKLRPDLAAGFRGSMAPTVEAQNKTEAEIMKAQGQLAQERAKIAEETRHHKVEESYMGQKDIPPAEITELEAKLDAVKALDDLKAQKGKSGLIDKLESTVGLGDFDQTKNVTAAEVAKADAKGRVNPSGAIRERQNLPGAFQNDTGIDAKRAQLMHDAEQHLKMLQGGRVRPEQIEQYQKQIDDLKQAAPTDAGGLAQVKSDADYQAVPPGGEYIAPDGSHRRKK